jgi:peptidoglycan/LPS O-acetylase OafA/YrhL
MYTLLGVTALLVAGGYITDVKWSSFVAAALYVRNLFGKGNTLDHMWSLSLEEQFYLSWPFMLMVTPKPVRLTMALACIGVVVAWRAAAISLHLFDYNLGIYYIRTDFRFDSILAGCALALAHRGTKFLAWVRFTPPLVLLAALLLTVRHPRGSYAYELTFQTALTTALVARLVMVDSDAFARLLSTPPLRWVGRLSYSWYLWQEMFLVTRTPSWGMVRQFPLNIVASLGAAMASYYIVERPFLRWKDVIASRKLRGPVAPVAFGANGGLCASDAPRNQVP